MNNKISEYIENAFANVYNTKKIQELKDELILNLTEKYNDELQQGKSEQEAYNAVIAGIGDIDELVNSVKEPSPLNNEKSKKSAMTVAVAVGLYIISPFVAAIFATLLYQPLLGACGMFLLIAIATGLLIYNHMTRPVYRKKEETIVEDFKKWCDDSNSKKDAYKAFKSAFWSVVVVVYLLMSFFTEKWSITWLIFILAGAIEQIIKAVLVMRGVDLSEKKPNH